jgi:uracil-DNA glycosylase family 4
LAKLLTLSLDELYAKEKKSRAAELAIISKDTFDKINDRYCESVCKLKCKNPRNVNLIRDEVDILIIQDHKAPAGKYDRRPGQQEEIQQGVLSFVCKEAGFAGLSFRLTNLSKCQPMDLDYPNGKSPTQTTLTKCYPYLHSEILRAKPKVIISLGTAATKAIGLKNHSNTGNRGEIAFSEHCPVIITLHPKITTYIRQNARGSAGMWGPDYLNVIINDFKKAAKLVRGELKYTVDTLQETVKILAADHIRVAKSLDDVKEFLAEMKALPESVIKSFDTETTGVDPLAADLRLLTIQFGWRDPVSKKLVAVVFPLWHRKNNYYNPDEAWGLIVPFLLDDTPKVGHNAKFDILVIYWTKGIRVRNVVFDTLLMLHSIYSGAQGTYSLKMAAWDYLTEMGFAGYENDLGDLKKLQKAFDKAAAKSKAAEEDEVEDEEPEVAEFAEEISVEEQIQFLIEREE